VRAERSAVPIVQARVPLGLPLQCPGDIAFRMSGGREHQRYDTQISLALLDEIGNRFSQWWRRQFDEAPGDRDVHPVGDQTHQLGETGDTFPVTRSVPDDEQSSHGRSPFQAGSPASRSLSSRA